MNTPTRLLAFAAALVVVFALAFGLGRLAPEVGSEDAPADVPSDTTSEQVPHEH